MRARLDSIEVYQRPSFGDKVAQTVFWFERDDVGLFSSFSIYVDRNEGARVIKRLGIKPGRIKAIERKKKTITIFLK